MNKTEYFKQLLEYRDILDDKMVEGKLGEEKVNHLTEKLNQWYEQATALEKAENVARVSAKVEKLKPKTK